ncbi:hypothetical protein RND59_10320 [Vibrio ruber]|nr:hypothetical protein [Vibrio ruber]WNJ94546.1 hypothetical protein RND59_10320 [Vibrio ruber]
MPVSFPDWHFYWWVNQAAFSARLIRIKRVREFVANGTDPL